MLLWKLVENIRQRRENGVDTIKLLHDTLSKTLKNTAWCSNFFKLFNWFYLNKSWWCLLCRRNVHCVRSWCLILCWERISFLRQCLKKRLDIPWNYIYDAVTKRHLHPVASLLKIREQCPALRASLLPSISSHCLAALSAKNVRIQQSHAEKRINYRNLKWTLEVLLCCNHSVGVALECAVHHERNVREEKHYIYVARTSSDRVITACDLCCCLRPRCEALRTYRSGFSDCSSCVFIVTQ